MKKQRVKLKNTPQVKKYNEVLKKASKMTREEAVKLCEEYAQIVHFSLLKRQLKI